MNLLWVFLIASAGALEISWLPLAMRFWRNYKERKNPISLAITGLITLMMMVTAMVFWIYWQVRAEWVLLTTQIMAIFVNVYFHIAIRIADRKFPDSRLPPHS